MAKIGYKKDVIDFNQLDAEGNPDYINKSRFDYVLLEKAEKILFKKFSFSTNYADWNKGRLFGEKTELKWQKRKDKFHFVVTTEDEMPSGFNLFSEKLEPVKDAVGNIPYRRIYLWGEQEENASGCPTGKWFEERIPQFIEYPIKTAKSRVIIKVKEYTLTEGYEVLKNGSTEKRECVSIVHRFVGLEEA